MFQSGPSAPSRRQFVLAALASAVPTEQSLEVRREADRLRVTGPDIRFLSGRPLEQLRNGVSVGFLSQVIFQLEPQGPPVERSLDRFVISFDLWEEKFSATRFGPPLRTTARMEARDLEKWCLDFRPAFPRAIAPDRRFWIRMELRAEDGKESLGVLGEPGLNLTRLIEIFSRPPNRLQQRWIANAGPLRFEEIRW